MLLLLGSCTDLLLLKGKISGQNVATVIDGPVHSSVSEFFFEIN